MKFKKDWKECHKYSFNCPWTPSLLLYMRLFGAVFNSRSSFFAPEPHGNACLAG